MKYEIIPSILVDTLEEFIERIEICEDFAETVQWDIMDGQFVEPITFNDPEQLEQVNTTLNIEAHMMVENPEEMFDALAKAGIDRVLVHFETVDDIEDIVSRMKEYDFESGIAISTETDIDDIPNIWEDVDMALVMTVVPSASGQAFMPEQLQKVSLLRELAPNLNIAVDGGVDMNTIKQAKEAGANIFGANSAIFKTPDPANSFEILNTIIQ